MKYTIETTNTADLYLSFCNDAPIHTVLETDKARLTLEGHTLALSIGGKHQATAELPFNEEEISPPEVTLFLKKAMNPKEWERRHDIEQSEFQCGLMIALEEVEMMPSYSLTWRIMLAFAALGLIEMLGEDSSGEDVFLFTSAYYDLYRV